jgi:hypothetical protein
MSARLGTWEMSAVAALLKTSGINPVEVKEQVIQFHRRADTPGAQFLPGDRRKGCC